MENVITVTVEGGVVQVIDGIPAGVTVRVIDFDTEGAEKEALTTLPNGKEAHVSEWASTEDTT